MDKKVRIKSRGLAVREGGRPRGDLVDGQKDPAKMQAGRHLDFSGSGAPVVEFISPLYIIVVIVLNENVFQAARAKVRLRFSPRRQAGQVGRRFQLGGQRQTRMLARCRLPEGIFQKGHTCRPNARKRLKRLPSIRSGEDDFRKKKSGFP